jgi:hypothetical protein
MVMVELFPEVIGFGEKLALAPDGRPLADSDTLWADPLVTVVEMVLVPLPPWATVMLLGLALIEKSLVAVPPQLGNLNDAIRVRQLNDPLAGMYSVVYQNVQSSAGSTVMEL